MVQISQFLIWRQNLQNTAIFGSKNCQDPDFGLFSSLRERAEFMRDPGRDYRQGAQTFLKGKKGGEDLFGEKKKGQRFFWEKKGVRDVS